MTVSQTRPEGSLHVHFQRHRLDQEGNYNECFSDFEKVRDFAKRFSLGHWSFLGPGEKEKWYGTHSYKSEGQWLSTADVMVANFQDSGHQYFSLDWGFLKKKGGRCTIHFSAESLIAELSFSSGINSANQQSIHGPIADWCAEVTQQISGPSISSMKKSVANVNEQLHRKLELEEVDTLVRTLETNVQAARDRLRIHQERFEK